MRRSLRILLRWPIRHWLHRRCLRRIALLEAELFPEEYVRGAPPNHTQVFRRPFEFELKPGARWLVDEPTKVQWLDDPIRYAPAMYEQDVLDAMLRRAD